jgi:hypothetical protein
VGGDQRAIESANLIAFDIDRPDHLSVAQDWKDEFRS